LGIVEENVFWSDIQLYIQVEFFVLCATMSALETWLENLEGIKRDYCNFLKNEHDYYSKCREMREQTMYISCMILAHNEVLIEEMDPLLIFEVQYDLTEYKLQMDSIFLERRNFRLQTLLPIEEKLNEIESSLHDNSAFYWRHDFNTLLRAGIQ